MQYPLKIVAPSDYNVINKCPSLIIAGNTPSTTAAGTQTHTEMNKRTKFSLISYFFQAE